MCESITPFKISLLLLLFFTIVFSIHNDSYAQDQKITLYASGSYTSLATSDFENFDISDWQRYGIKCNDPYSAEGRVRLPLKDNDVSGMKWGVLGGLIYPLSERLGALAEVQYSFKNDFKLLGGFLGINYDLINSKNFKLGLTPKVGYLYGEVDFGEIELIEDYTPPVIIDQGTFTNGDSLSMDIEGIGLQIGITPSYEITEQIGIMAHIGYAFSFPRDCKIKVNDGKIKLKMDDQAIVKADCLNNQAGIEPEAKSQGLFFQVGISYKLQY